MWSSAYCPSAPLRGTGTASHTAWRSGLAQQPNTPCHPLQRGVERLRPHPNADLNGGDLALRRSGFGASTDGLCRPGRTFLRQQVRENLVARFFLSRAALLVPTGFVVEEISHNQPHHRRVVRR